MANRYQDRPADDDDGDAMHALPKSDSDPLAELARLIGQTDPFSNFGRGAGVSQGGDDARVRFDFAVAADRGHFLFLQNSQKLNLHLGF